MQKKAKTRSRSANFKTKDFSLKWMEKKETKLKMISGAHCPLLHIVTDNTYSEWPMGVKEACVN